MNTLAEKIEPLARDVSFTEDALHVVLADGREISAPLQWFPASWEPPRSNATSGS